MGRVELDPAARVDGDDLLLDGPAEHSGGSGKRLVGSDRRGNAAHQRASVGAGDPFGVAAAPVPHDVPLDHGIALPP